MPEITQEQLDAVIDMAYLDGQVWHDIATSLTCTEAETVATFLEAFEIDGQGFLASHSTGDDGGDLHEPVLNAQGYVTCFRRRTDEERV